jgi:hypothetical protein
MQPYKRLSARSDLQLHGSLRLDKEEHADHHRVAEYSLQERAPDFRSAQSASGWGNEALGVTTIVLIMATILRPRRSSPNRVVPNRCSADMLGWSSISLSSWP